ncbi:phosphoethanolamine--lipid A transferase [Acinetobacter sp. ME22]|uniref:phosphoethanolamine transferase n=1 Tax=Acinetobacter sp. ME22 TaxID=2904802 RepID=UPI001EDB4790|nr:phosphoethanolamine--lipid A transferase [Acinetobacter sp. ME22]MCG2574350.1 phosphoethanolamine--lipid A transferase [Acinetobacter sp. ME22]
MLKIFSQVKTRLKPISLSRFNFIIAAWLALALNFTFYQQSLHYADLTGAHSAIFAIGLGLVLTLYYFIFMQILSWQWNKKWIACLLLFIGGCSAYFVNSMGIMITPEQIQNMMQTDHTEALNLLSWQYLVWFVLMVVLPIGVVIILPVKKDTLLPLLGKKFGSIIVAVALAGGAVYLNYINFSSLFRGHREVKNLISPNNVFSSGLSYYKKLSYKPLPLLQYGLDARHNTAATVNQKPKLMVLVVGETARAESFSLNGYGKNTNPELAKVTGLINFTQASSCGTATAVSVPCMFSGMPRTEYDERLASHREGLLDIAKRAGYQITWIENDSGCKGVCNRVNNFVIPDDIKKKYCENRDYCLDGVLLESLQRYLEQIPATDHRPQLVVLHQIGSHGPAYYQRTTPEFAPFQPICDTTAIQSCERSKLINSYDNSIVYTDHILSKIIGVLAQNDKYQTGFWYLSDHGESTGENGLYLHGAPYALAPSQQTHIPMMMWFSPEWQRSRPQQVACLMQQRQAKRGQDNLFPTLLGLLDVESQTIQPKLNMLAQCANP